MEITFTKHDWRDVIPMRVLEKREQSLVEFLLSPSFPGCSELRQQMAFIRVQAVCFHCPSVAFYLDRSLAPAAAVNRRIPIEARGFDVDGMPLEILLHVSDGYLNELEIYREDGLSILSLPEPNALSLFSLDDL